ncbi:hypothetical protein D9M69_595810 [compost metagenome]
MAEFLARIFKPLGPMITPARIRPMMPGMFSRRSRIGDSKIINRINENTSTGLLRGNSNSCNI